MQTGMGMLIIVFASKVKQEEGNYNIMWLSILNIHVALSESIFVKYTKI